jgi:predicted TIM-barrel fold metal-dependent hydrolase
MGVRVGEDTRVASTPVIDSDQHLYETRTVWGDHIDPGMRAEALRIEDDELGYPWLMWRDRKLGAVDVQYPRQTSELGERRERIRAGLPNDRDYDEELPRDYWDASARADQLANMGVDEAVVFPNFGLLWERPLDEADLGALTANMTAWNRWCGTVAADGRGQVHPVAHCTLRDADWLHAELTRLERDSVRLAMIAPATVDGRPLSHPDHDPIWRAFVEHGVTPLFHVANQKRPFEAGWYTEPEDSFVPPLESVFLWVPGALGATDLILNGVFDRIPELKLGIVELSAVWVPMFVMMLDGGYDFTTKLNGRAIAELQRRPSEYFYDRVRVSSFSYELPSRLTKQTRDIYMACSDYPHSEGTATPIADYANSVRPCSPEDAPAFFGENASFLISR